MPVNELWGLGSVQILLMLVLFMGFVTSRLQKLTVNELWGF